MRYLSGSAGRSRAAARPAPSAAPTRRSRSATIVVAALIAVVPLALGLGVLLGRAGNGEDAKLLAALRAQKPEVLNLNSGAGTAAATAPSASAQPVSLTSDFTLPKGYAVELGVLPQSGTTQASASAVEKADQHKGAPAVGLLNQSDYAVTPAPPSGDYVIYSGQYKTQAEAEKALAKLKKAFPHARVIAVNSTSGSGGAGAVLSTTNYGSFNSVVGINQPSQAQLNAGSQAAQKVASQINGSYVNSQQGLPNQISVP